MAKNNATDLLKNPQGKIIYDVIRDEIIPMIDSVYKTLKDQIEDNWGSIYDLMSPLKEALLAELIKHLLMFFCYLFFR